MPEPSTDLLPIIDAADADASARIAEIRRLLSPRGDVVSERGRQLTLDVFGAALTPRQVVGRICEDVRQRGTAAVLEYTRKLDGAEMTADQLRVPAERLARAHAAAEADYLTAVRGIRGRIERFQKAILHQPTTVAGAGHRLRQVYRPLRRVGVCVPGGAAAYPSTLLMAVVPAQAAGVGAIAVMAPPTPFGADNDDLLAACHELGVDEVYRMGGSQGVAALAYGTADVPAVDKVVGPGNLFVALAKQTCGDTVGIDMMAGPSEVVVLADATARPDWVAADLIAQAEHDPGSSILVCWDGFDAAAVQRCLTEQVATLSRGAAAVASLRRYGAVVVAADEEQGCRLANELATEHLHIQTRDPEATLARIDHAGAVFLGPHTPVAVGDYVAGPSHTLPTGGSARFAHGLCANDFRRSMSVIEYDRDMLAAVAPDLRLVADKEGLTAHRASVDVRLPAAPQPHR